MNKLFAFVYHLFVPSHKNNFRAKLLHLDFLFVLIIGMALLSPTINWAEKSSVLGFAKDIRVDQLLELTNRERTSQGLPPLAYSNQLQFAAQSKAQYMLARNCWAHFCGDKSPWDFILESGYSYEVAGENLAKGFMFSDGVVEGWKNSPTHWANIIKPEYDEVGFAVLNGNLDGEETTLVVQMFGKRLAEAEPVPNEEANQLAQEDNDSLLGALCPLEALAASGTTDDTPATASVTKVEEDFASTGASITENKGGLNISLKSLTFRWSTLLFGLLLAALIADLFFTHKKDLIRVTGKNLAHIIFIAALIIALLIIKNGVIL